ncbi:MAG: anti-sigma factor family protein [Armatimonadota bacterium]
MDCKSVRKLLPELASGEICGKPAQDAEEHMSACRPCADEFASYKEAMNALAGPHAVFDAPSRLTMSDLSKARRSGWVYVLPAAAVIIIIGLILMLPSVRHAPDTRVAIRPDASASVDVGTTKVVKPIVSDSRPHEMVHRKAVSMAVHKSPALRRNPISKTERRMIADLEREAAISSEIRSANADTDAYFEGHGNDPPNKSGFVIVSRSEYRPESSIEIRSIDHSTGTITSYSARTDSDGNEQSILITSSKVEEDNGRDTL